MDKCIGGIMIRVGNAPCSWGIIETITQNRFTAAEVLEQISKSGYVGSELGDWGFLPTEPNELKEFASNYNLIIMASWVSVILQDKNHFDEDLAQCMRVAKLLKAAFPNEGHRIVLGNDPFADKERVAYAGRIKPEQYLCNREPEQWKHFLINADRLADEVYSETGVQVVFHHHTGTWIETDEEIEALLEGTKKVGLCFDTGHYTQGGAVASLGIRKYASRIRHIHFKDCDEDLNKKGISDNWDALRFYREGVFPELGKGTVDFKDIFAEITKMNYDGWIIVEQDIMDDDVSDPYQSAVRNREFIAKLGV